MLIKNIDVESGLVNGSLGTIINFVTDPSSTKLVPTVEFDNGISKVIGVVSWDLEIDDCIGSATQVPLMLAYSITVHRSQSLTLDSAVLDLEDAFCNAMVYVALSRLRSLDGMYLKSFNPKKITVNKVMKEFLESLVNN
jgi:ATP-dependent DNA helicase PIF1